MSRTKHHSDGKKMPTGRTSIKRAYQRHFVRQDRHRAKQQLQRDPESQPKRGKIRRTIYFFCFW